MGKVSAALQNFVLQTLQSVLALSAFIKTRVNICNRLYHVSLMFAYVDKTIDNVFDLLFIYNAKRHLVNCIV